MCIRINTSKVFLFPVVLGQGFSLLLLLLLLRPYEDVCVNARQSTNRQDDTPSVGGKGMKDRLEEVSKPPPPPPPFYALRFVCQAQDLPSGVQTARLQGEAIFSLLRLLLVSVRFRSRARGRQAYRQTDQPSIKANPSVSEDRSLSVRLGASLKDSIRERFTMVYL